MATAIAGGTGLKPGRNGLAAYSDFIGANAGPAFASPPEPSRNADNPLSGFIPLRLTEPQRLEPSESRSRKLMEQQVYDKLRSQTTPLRETIRRAWQDIRNAFDHAGMPIIDIVHLEKKSPGRFKVSSWGKGVRVSHPQQKFLEAVFNGTACGFTGLTTRIQALLNKIDNVFTQIQACEAEKSQQLGQTLRGKNSYFDDCVVFAVKHLDTNLSTAQELSENQQDYFNTFKVSLGAELDLLSHRQVYSRFYFSAFTLPRIQAEFSEFF